MSDRGGRRGGLILLWNSDADAEITSYSTNHIDVIVHNSDGGGDWRFTGLYGWPEDQHKWKTWRLIDTLAVGNTMPWLCVGDFNEILFHYEKHGGLPRRESRMEDFRQCLERNELIDLGSGGSMYTWSNMQSGPGNIRERLDRGVANSSWMARFPKFRVKNLLRVLSDHSPLEIRWDSDEVVPRRSRRRPFRFEEKWLQEPQCREVVRDAWASVLDNSYLKVMSNIEGCGKSLKAWGSALFGDLANQIEETSKKLAAIQLRAPIPENLQLAKLEENKLAALLRKDELHWLQRSRISWMRDGDKNTKYSHRTASGRRSRNRILKITDGDGFVWEEAEEMERVFTEYFTGIFTTKGELVLQEAMDAVEHKVTSEMEVTLSQLFTREEITTAFK
ncbi:hypothetical protein ACS0TY_000564 [Phlomoides rotata]